MTATQTDDLQPHRDPVFLGLFIIGITIVFAIMTLCSTYLFLYVRDRRASVTHLSKTDIIKMVDQCQSAAGTDTPSDVHVPLRQSIVPADGNLLAKITYTRHGGYATRSAPVHGTESTRSKTSINANQHNATLPSYTAAYGEDLDMGEPRDSADGRYYRFHSDVSTHALHVL